MSQTAIRLFDNIPSKTGAVLQLSSAKPFDPINPSTTILQSVHSQIHHWFLYDDPRTKVGSCREQNNRE